MVKEGAVVYEEQLNVAVCLPRWPIMTTYDVISDYPYRHTKSCYTPTQVHSTTTFMILRCTRDGVRLYLAHDSASAMASIDHANETQHNIL
jgi:hypothetical protein